MHCLSSIHPVHSFAYGGNRHPEQMLGPRTSRTWPTGRTAP